MTGRRLIATCLAGLVLTAANVSCLKHSMVIYASWFLGIISVWIALATMAGIAMSLIAATPWRYSRNSAPIALAYILACFFSTVVHASAYYAKPIASLFFATPPFPYAWLLPAALVPYSVVVPLHCVFMAHQYRLKVRRCCLYCRYSLDGLSQQNGLPVRCPECGRIAMSGRGS